MITSGITESVTFWSKYNTDYVDLLLTLDFQIWKIIGTLKTFTLTFFNTFFKSYLHFPIFEINRFREGNSYQILPA